MMCHQSCTSSGYQKVVSCVKANVQLSHEAGVPAEDREIDTARYPKKKIQPNCTKTMEMGAADKRATRAFACPVGDASGSDYNFGSRSGGALAEHVDQPVASIRAPRSF